MNTNGLDLVQERTDPFVRTLAGRRVMGSSARIWRLNDELSTPRLPGAGYLRDLLHQPGRVRVGIMLQGCVSAPTHLPFRQGERQRRLASSALLAFRSTLGPRKASTTSSRPPAASGGATGQDGPASSSLGIYPAKKMSFLTRLAAVAGTCFQSFEEMSCFPCFSKKNIPKEEELVPPVSGVVKEHEPNGKPGEVLSLRTFLFLPNVTHISADQKPLSWYTRMRIAHGAAQGLEYLHEKANPPVIYRDLKSSNILLDEDFNAKLSDSGFARLGPMGDKVHVSSMVMGTDGYCAPEYARTDQLTVKSDVYSFGVVVLELITGRRVIDASKPTNEQNLVAWALPMFRDQKRYPELVDPLLQRDYPAKGLSQAVAVAAMCLQEEASVRPLMADVVKALSFLTTAADSLPEDDVSEDEQSDENSD
ncbi:hypothetical protein BHE74_00015140 [Ensete ventricosum]|nr:hypothetical protein BHE74_00015140 [Ensete ventricosum]